MLDEQKMTVALNVETSGVDLPNALLAKIKREASKTQPQPWWSLAGRGPKLVASFFLVAILAGWAHTVWASKPKPVDLKSLPTQAIAVERMPAFVGFQVGLPDYLPEGMSLDDSRLYGDSAEPSARLRVVGLTFKKRHGGMVLQEWTANQAEPFPPGDLHGALMDTDSMTRTVSSIPVQVGQVQGTDMAYLLSGLKMHRIYWHVNGVNYAVAAASDHVPPEELLKVARSIH